MRPLRALSVVAALLVSSTAVSGADFVPDARATFSNFQALKTPRADVPLGALWIVGFGPSGAPAATDNLETVRSLSGLTIDKNLQMSLGLGILDLLGIDPKLRNHYTARFTDLSIVKVKDLSKLTGIKGEPRIVEALKAGTVSVTSDSGFGLSAQTLTNAWQVTGTSQNDRNRQFSIEARDMFIAIHVATAEIVRGDEQELRPEGRGEASLSLDDYLLKLAACAPSAQACPPKIGITKRNSQTQEPTTYVALSSDVVELALPVPRADGKGGLYDQLAVRRLPSCAEAKASGCRREPRYFATYRGTRLKDLSIEPNSRW